jgi:hypothetical protein
MGLAIFASGLPAKDETKGVQPMDVVPGLLLGDLFSGLPQPAFSEPTCLFLGDIHRLKLPVGNSLGKAEMGVCSA